MSAPKPSKEAVKPVGTTVPTPPSGAPKGATGWRPPPEEVAKCAELVGLFSTLSSYSARKVALQIAALHRAMEESKPGGGGGGGPIKKTGPPPPPPPMAAAGGTSDDVPLAAAKKTRTAPWDDPCLEKWPGSRLLRDMTKQQRGEELAVTAQMAAIRSAFSRSKLPVAEFTAIAEQLEWDRGKLVERFPLAKSPFPVKVAEVTPAT